MTSTTQMKSVIVRFSPMLGQPVVFLSDTRSEGQIEAFVNGKMEKKGIDYYASTEPLSDEDSKAVALEFAKWAKIPSDELVVRQRLPKTMKPRTRRLNDTNLVLVPTQQQAAEQPKEPAPKTLAELAQVLHDQATKKEEVKPVQAVESPAKKQKRKYVKKSPKSLAAYKRYVEELAASASASPTLMEAVKTDAPKEVVDDAVMNLALALARILKGNPGVL